MMLLPYLLTLALVGATPASCKAQLSSNAIGARQWSGSQQHNSSSLEIDLGYSIYRGYANSTAELNIWKGISFANPPTGSLRWQAPRAPVLNRSEVISAIEYAATCPQSPDALTQTQAPSQANASEDCLFLNVWSPSNATGPLPVFVWIHGGGYGEGSGRQDLEAIINTNENSFVGITIQYRLGAFGFLASDEVFRKGVVNAGILDQHFALQWVQDYIHLFNGDPSRVTIAGESAGAGSVMLQDMAYGGSLGTQLFQNSIAASPYLPMQYEYKDWIPSQAYYAFAAAVGCDAMKPYGTTGTVSTFECLVSVDSAKLINASLAVSQLGVYGTWAFLPVTDGVFVQDLPSRQLGKKQINGVNLLIGNNANEGPLFTPQNITTESDLLAWLELTFPLFTTNDIAKILRYYPASNASVDPNATLYATTGDSGPNAITQSSVGTGQEERADLIYGETTFICPSYWMAEAYSQNGVGGQAYKYQFSVPPALHGSDPAAYFNPPGTPPYSSDLAIAFQKIWGNFITSSNPSISNAVADGVSTGNASVNAASSWPPYSINAPYMIDLNTTCGTERLPAGEGLNFTTCTGPGTYNTIRLVDAYTWEGGRGVRCDFWRSVGEIVPE